METKPKSWWIDFVLVCSVLLLAESARGVVIGTLSPYVNSLGGDEFFLAVVVAAFSAGRLIASFAFGALSDYWTTRSVLLLSTVGCIVGNGMFAMASSVQSKYVLLISRVLTGFGTGMLSVARTHISVTTPTGERTLWMSWLGIVQFVGFAITPVVGNVNVSINLGIVTINNYTFATLILLVLEIVLFVLLLAFMSRTSPKEKRAENTEQEQIDVVNVSEARTDDDSTVSYHQMNDNDEIEPNDPSDSDHLDETKETYLDGDVVLPLKSESVVDSASEKSLVSQHDRAFTVPIAPSATDKNSRFASHPTLPSMATSRDVIVYVEEARTPRQQHSVFAPHHFVLHDDPNNDNGSGPVLVPTDEALNAMQALAANNEPPALPVAEKPSLLHRMWNFLYESYVPLVFVLLNLSGRGTLSVAEVYGTTLYDTITSPDDQTVDTAGASTFFLIMGCLGLVVFLLMNRLVKYVEETSLLMLAFVSMGIGFGVICDFDDYDIDIYDFTAGMTLVWVIGTPISQTLSVSMLSKHFTLQEKQGGAAPRVGFWMGTVTAAGSVGRIVFPLIAGALYGPYGVSSAMLFTSIASFLTVLLIFFPLRAYQPYTSMVRERIPCLFHSDDDLPSGHEPLTLARGSSAELTRLVETQPPQPSLAYQQSIGVSPMLYFAVSQSQSPSPSHPGIPIVPPPSAAAGRSSTFSHLAGPLSTVKPAPSLLHTQ